MKCDSCRTVQNGIEICPRSKLPSFVSKSNMAGHCGLAQESLDQKQVIVSMSWWRANSSANAGVGIRAAPSSSM